MTPHIAILGAGPSGLMLGRILQQAGIDFVIFERDEKANAAIGQGGTLDLHEGAGLLALEHGDLIGEFKSKARYDIPLVMTDSQGQVQFSHGESGDSSRPEIDRKDLRALLLASVHEEKVRWNHRVESVDKDASSGLMSIAFANGRTESGLRLIVAADGAWSKARRLVTSAQPEYSGLHYLTTNLSPQSPVFKEVESRVHGGCYLAFGHNKQVSVQRLTEGSYHISIGLRLSERWSTENAELFRDAAAVRRMLLKDYFAGWSKVHTDAIEFSDSPWKAWPLYAMSTSSLTWKTVPGVALIGDAAHVTTPFVGEGVNCAMMDSVQLGQKIIKHGVDDLTKAVEKYEKEMFPRAIDLISRSAKSGKLMFADDSPKSWLEALMSGEI